LATTLIDAKADAKASALTAATAPVIIDMGKHRRKRIKDLRRGTGRLADEISGCVEELKAAGTLASSAQTVVVVVREKRRRISSLLPGL
jgi:hypothetical protein